MIYVSSCFGAAQNNMSCVLPVIIDQNNNNILIAIDLFKDIEKLINFCQEVYFDDVFIKNLFNFGVVLLHLNRCPILAPIETVRKEDFNRLNFNISVLNKNINLIKNNDSFVEKIKIIFSKKKNFNKSFNVDLEIYHSFFNSHDKKIIEVIRQTKPISLKNINFNFHDVRLNRLLFRYRARNFFYTLDNNEKKIWLIHCMNVFNPLSLKEYRNKIHSLLKKHSNNVEKVILLKQLLDYVFKKYKKLFFKDINLD